jgi:transposase-like protein
MAPRNGLSDLPPEILRQIAAEASAVDRIALAYADPRVVYPAIADEVRADTIVTTDAPRVNTLAGFLALLNNGARPLQGLPESLRGEALGALGARIPRMLADDQQPAIDAFLASARSLPEPMRPALLNELMQAMANGPGGLAKREKAAVAFDGPATVSVDGGENVQAVVQRHGITDPSAIALLECSATYGPASDAVKRGEDVQVVAQRLGISDPAKIAFLKEKAAKRDIVGGENVQAVAQRHGLTDPEYIAVLEGTATFGPASDAVQRGEDVQVVTQRLGISAPWNIATLTKLANARR